MAWRWISTTTAMRISSRCGSIAIVWRAWSACCRPRYSATRIGTTLDYAADLGLAFQLTNIIRDVGEDARRNRIYLPLDEMRQHGVSAGEIVSAKETDNFRQLMEFQIERALGYYRQALAALPAVDRRSQRAGLVMAAIYRTLLDEIRADGCRVLTRRTSLTPIRKLWIAWKTWVKG